VVPRHHAWPAVLYEEILVKNPNVAQIRRRIADRIQSVPGVLDIVSLDLDFDRAARTLSVSFAK
jgi:hypothetical protein